MLPPPISIVLALSKNDSQTLTPLAGKVYDVTRFITEHPGGGNPINEFISMGWVMHALKRMITINIAYLLISILEISIIL